MSRKYLFLILSIFLFSFYGMASSQDYFRIARLSYVEGKVSFQHAGDLDWVAVSINMPLEPGDRLYTGDGGRAEIEFDDGSVIRLAPRTDVEMLAMKEQHVQMRLLLGLCFLTDRSSVEFEINTPAAAFNTKDKGNYRFEVAENGDTYGIVRKGEMEAANNRFSRRVESGQMLHIPAEENTTEVLSPYRERDAWDEWNDRRNADLISYQSRRYLPDGVYYGVGDLDRYGRWVTVDGYGYGWVPSVSVGWSPYWDGRWCYRPYFGWTWVSYEPWGWLPYHYGRWYHHTSFGWCWLPGASFGFHFWSPGLVRFYHGRDWISWCALGPGDYYNVNNYHYNPTYNYYINNLRLTQRRGPEDLVNKNSPGAMRSVRAEQFVDGGFAGDIGRSRNDPGIGRGDPIVTGRLDIQPTARSYAPAPERAAVRPTAAASRAVVVRTEPEVRSPDSRYQRITNPEVAVPRARADAAGRDTARDARPATGSAYSGTERAPDRGAVPGRSYQVPSGSGNARNPATINRDVQRVPDRQEAVPRTQQPPATSRTVSDMPARRMESQPQRSVNPDQPRVQRSEPTRPVSGPPAERSVAPSRQDPARPQTPPAGNKPPDPPVIKKSDQETVRSSYSASQPQRWQQPSAGVRPAPLSSLGRSESYAGSRSVGSYAPRSIGGSAASPSVTWSGPSSARPAPSTSIGRSQSQSYAGARSVGSSAPRSMGSSMARPSVNRAAPPSGGASRSSAASPRRR
jgi:hypothetical protein